MNVQVEIGSFLKLIRSIPVLDVRSPSEYAVGHIPNAINLPLFSDAERKTIGIIYKNEGKQEAIKRGLDFVGPQMSSIIKAAELLESNKLLIHCWRGGLRSESMAWLLSTYGFKVKVLHGGYKQYRSAIIDYFNQSLPLMVLSGYTGSKKTEVLHALKNRGEQVIDLEGIACHQGSSFGRQLSVSQPTVEHFQNLLFEHFRELNVTTRIWVEDESFHIGRVNLVEGFYQQKNISPHVFLDVPLETRLKHLVITYGKLSKNQLIKATENISKKLGKRETREAIECIESSDLKNAAKIILSYYDRQYKKALDAKSQHIILHENINSNNPDEIAELLITKLKHEGIQTHAV